MMRNFSKILIVLASLALFLGGCSDSKFHLKGEIEGASGDKISLEKSDFYGRWVSLDSIKVGKNGKFNISFPAPAAPEIYRLALNDHYIYFPVDSTETITVKTSVAGFGRDFSLSGSPMAQHMESFEKELQGISSISGDTNLDEFKKEVFSKYMQDNQGSVVSFYILTKTIDGKPLYDPANSRDAKYFGAVATGFKTRRPNDPRTALLERTTIEAMKKRNSEAGNYLQIEANEISMLDLELQDESGKLVKLSDVAGKGKPVAVVFSLLTAEDSPDWNFTLAQIYNRKNGSVEFYNVALDPDQYDWREAAKNLPWITVYAPSGLNSEAARLYNVGALPAFFVYNSSGELIQRPASLKEMEDALR